MCSSAALVKRWPRATAFVAKELPLGGPVLPGNPLDPEQVCPVCAVGGAR